ncbi:hypothetical protein GDO86_004513 [Hymenochirus boettgeri]|uniref:Spartin n=1 Tax=Hymenochirus boettgeri TaxID=247094 RepID=A0A8T2KAY1_9PIPI|nr:hypothetical protein GDO86_004513 [Hymenochirus boettgeri]
MEKKTPPETLENTILRSIEDEYRKAFIYINKGLNTDETGYKEEARNYYMQGREHLIRGLNISVQRPGYAGQNWDTARQMQVKMEETLENVNTRLNILQQSISSLADNPSAENASVQTETQDQTLQPKEKEKPERPTLPKSLNIQQRTFPVNEASYVPGSEPAVAMNPFMGAAAPPVYTPQATDGHYTVSYGTESGELSFVGDGFYSRKAQPPPVQSLGVDAEELILIPQGVQIFFVTPEGLVSAPSYPGYLRIVKFMDTSSEMAQNRPPAFLQVCDWLYPLMCNHSPVLRSNSGAYMFPDMMSEAPGSYVGVVLSSELPVADQELFEDLLKQMSDLKIQPFEASEVIDLSHTIHIVPIPEEEKGQVPEWSQRVAQGIMSVDGVCSIASCVGRELAPHVKKHGSKLLPESLKKDKDGKSPLNGAMVVAASGVQGFATVWQGLELAGKNIAKSVASETVHTVKHKYGNDAGHATDHAVNSAINVGVTAFNVDNIGIKAIVKKTAKETSHAILDEYKILEKEEKKEEKD